MPGENCKNGKAVDGWETQGEMSLEKPGEREPRYRVFISYSHQDKDLVLKIAKILQDNGLKPMWDRDFALATEERIYPEEHPKLPHRINNLASVLLVLNRPAEAQELLARAWKLKQGHHDITSTRVLFNRLGVAALAGKTADAIIGQLKRLLLLGERKTNGNVSSRSESLACVVKSLRARGVPGIEFLEALGNVVNGETPATDLDKFPAWREQAPVSLDTPWPE